MAETLLDALVKLNFEGEGAVGAAADAVRRIESELKKIGGMSGVDFKIGGDLSNTLASLGDVQHAFGRLIQLGEQAEAALRLDPKNTGAAENIQQIVGALQQQLSAIHQVELAQAQADKTAISQSRAVEARLERQARLQERLQQGSQRATHLDALVGGGGAGGGGGGPVATGGGAGGGRPLTNFQRLEAHLKTVQPDEVTDRENEARTSLALAKDARDAARKKLNALLPTQDEYRGAEREAATAIRAVNAANRQLEAAIQARIKAEEKAAEQARQTTQALALRGTPSYANLTNPGQAQFLGGFGVDPATDVPTQQSQLQQRLKENALATNAAQAAALYKPEELAKLTEERARLEVGLNAAKATELKIAAKTNEAAAKAAEAQRVRATPEAANLKADPDTFLRSLGVDPKSPVATQRARLTEALAEIDRKELALKTDGLNTESQRAALTKQRGRIELAANAMAEKEAQAIAAATKAKQDAIDASKDTRLSRLVLPPEEYAEARGIDTGQPLTRQKLQLAMQQNELARSAIKEEAERIALLKQDKASIARVSKLDEEMTRLVQQEIALRQQMASLEAREKKAAKGASGFLGGLFGKNEDDDGFGQGLAHSAGMTLRFYAMYAGFAALQQALAGVFQMTEQYTLAVHDLSVALGSSYEEAAKAGSEYAKIGEQFGVGPVESIQGATKGLRSFRNEDGSENPASGAAFARLTSIITTLEPEDRRANTQQDIIAVAKAFQIGANGLEGLYDKLLAVSHEYGYGTPGEILSGTAAVADIGKESGYTPEALAAAIASVMQGTGTTSDAAAGDLKRFLGAQNDPALIQMFERYGISQDGSFKEKIDQLGEKLSTVDPEQRTRDLTSLGGPRIASAVNALIAGLPEANRAQEKAKGAGGDSAKQAQEILDTLGGVMQKLGGELKLLFASLANSGLGALFVAIAKGATQTVTALRQMIDLWNNVPDVLKNVAAAITLLLAVGKAALILNGAKAAIGGVIGSLLPAAASAGAGAAAAGGGAAAATWIGRAASALGAAAVSGASLVAALGPLAAVVGGIMLVSAVKSQADLQEVNANASLDASQSLDKSLKAGDVQGAQAGIAALEQANIENAKGNDGFINGVLNLEGIFSDDGVKAQRQKMMDAIAKKIALAKQQVAKQMADEAASDTAQPRSEWFGKNFNNIGVGVDLIKAKGVGADDTSAIIADFFARAPKDKVREFLQPVDGKGLEATVQYEMTRIGQGNDPLAQTSSYGKLHDVLTDAKTRVAATGDATQIEALRGLADQVDRAWAASVVETTKAKIDVLSGSFTGKESEQKIQAVLTDGLNKAVASGDVNRIVELLNLADREFVAQYKASVEARNAVLASVQDGLNAALDMAGSAFASISEPADTGNVHNDIRGDMADKSKARVQSHFDTNFAAQNKALQDAFDLANPTGSATKKPGDDLAIAKAMEAARSGDGQQAAAAQLKAAQIRLAATLPYSAAYYDALKAVNDAKKAVADYELNRSLAETAAGVEAGNPMATARNDIAATLAKISATTDPVEYWTLLKQLHEQQRSYAEMQLAEAEAEANANVLPNDPLAGAVNAMNQAKARMDFYKGKDSAKYFEQLKAYRQAQYDAAMIELEMANNQALLTIDITDPVAMARQRVKQSEARLAYDRQRGAGRDVILGDEAALRQNKSDEASTKWHQNFDDMRTNYDLNRIGLTAYLQYLRSQHDLLTAVKVKTRDQINELNEVDAAIKGLTDSMQGQWNLGDIKVPTAYEMRRNIAGGMAAGVANVSYVTINMNGSSAAEMKAIVQGAIGQPILQTVGTSAPKV